MPLPIHHVLKGCWGVGEAKEHNRRFKEATVGDKSRLPFVAFFDTDVFITPANVEFGEIFSAFQFVHKIRNQRERVAITDGYVV